MQGERFRAPTFFRTDRNTSRIRQGQEKEDVRPCRYGGDHRIFLRDQVHGRDGAIEAAHWCHVRIEFSRQPGHESLAFRGARGKRRKCPGGERHYDCMLNGHSCHRVFGRDFEPAGIVRVDGVVELIRPDSMSLKVPHVGWNDVNYNSSCFLFEGISNDPSFYFVHSYHLNCPKSIVTSTTDYGYEITASIAQGNIIGTQFHPEKSKNTGLKLLSNFLKMSYIC